MNTSGSFEALRRANPRAKAGFAESVETAAEEALTRIASTATGGSASSATRGAQRRRLVHVSAVGATLAAAAAAVSLLSVGFPRGSGVEDAAAAVTRSATLTAASAERSGAAVVRITHNRELWAGSTIRWHGADVAVSSDAPRRAGRAGSELLVVDGTMYGQDLEGWIVLGSPDSIDPDSGTTPAEYLAAVREDVGGETLRRITNGLRGLTTSHLDDGSTVYSGAVAARLVARESGFKEGRPIRVLPFGYVAHDEAADPGALLDVAATVGTDGVFREIAVSWGSAGSWTYTVSYRGLGATPSLVAPANARPLRDRSPAGEPRAAPGS